MQIKRCTSADDESWLALRNELWPDVSQAEHRQEVDDLFRDGYRYAVFLCRAATGDAMGFAEVSLRNDYVNGCGAGPVAFVEGIFVRSEHRRKGVARRLCEAIESWARERDCAELASDVEFRNLLSQWVHAALGFEETERVIFYRKRL
jgi:aminoglycoside 6'-N-acetyltransferase I